jgi:hypothetical protein
MRLPMRCLIAVCLLFPGTGRAQTEGTYLYEVSLLRAAPGRFADFIDAVRADSALSVEAGDAVPFVIRHSQGDHWDFLRITPIESFAAYHAPDRSARRARVWNGARGRALRARLDSVTAHREEWFAHSVAVDDLAERFRGMGLFHVEMFVGLAGRRTDLVEQRRRRSDSTPTCRRSRPRARSTRWTNRSLQRGPPDLTASTRSRPTYARC